MLNDELNSLKILQKISEQSHIRTKRIFEEHWPSLLTNSYLVMNLRFSPVEECQSEGCQKAKTD